VIRNKSIAASTRAAGLLAALFAASFVGPFVGLAGATPHSAPPTPAASPPARPLLIQGALEAETALLVSRLQGAEREDVAGWSFWRGTLEGVPVVVSRTGMGTANAAAATAIAIERFAPSGILNQGTAGGHDPALAVGDVVLGASAVNLAAFKTPPRAAGTGSNALGWAPMDVVQRAGDEDGDLHEGQVGRIAADPSLLAAARHSGAAGAAGTAGAAARKWRVVEGVIGSSEVWNEEIDRIRRLRETHGTSVEEMETFPVAQVAKRFGVPFLGIRVVTANVTNGGGYDPKTAETCQEFVLHVVRAIGANGRRDGARE
jgi:adenosylhomocysteine nucleosidase